MINHSLQLFCNRTVAAGRITVADTQALMRDVLSDGLTHRDEADMLIALDRAVPQIDPAFRLYLTAAIVDFTVWGERPTGTIDSDTARWLAASLRNGTGPTFLAGQIAQAVVREAQSCDEALIAFALEANRRRAAEPTPVEFLAAA
ncbi:hypothetical protein [Methylobacterium sp. J-090]|uniref:hypothetical protein n=1 Tax=Methylobacterium sp. J-090 TaxID=2836666 RepID=UPI001FBC070B|nr:hypothetical protein [Methylobacterium sp. J-090]MCJ2082896.1 hypothetical protein [Methylobacterium sp. J-090]